VRYEVVLKIVRVVGDAAQLFVTSPSAASSCAAEFQLTLFQDAEFQEAEFQLALFQLALFHETLFQLALFHETLFQLALFQDAEFQEALFHETLFHEAFASAALFHEAVSNATPPDVASVLTNWSRPAFGFGGSLIPAALFAVISPTPAEPAAPLTGRVVSISAPLIWSGVKPGCRAMI